MCFGYSKELSHREGSFEYPQHMFWMRNKEKNSNTHSYQKAWYMYAIFLQEFKDTSNWIAPVISCLFYVLSTISLQDTACTYGKYVLKFQTLVGYIKGIDKQGSTVAKW